MTVHTYLLISLTLLSTAALDARPQAQSQAQSQVLPQSQPQAPAFHSYPKENEDIRSGFANPPKGYGNVPFFWWSGDSLRLDRLAWELEMLADSPTEGFSISYHHNNPQIDNTIRAFPDPSDCRLTHGGYGLPDKGKPEAYSEEWWKIWNDFSGLCADKGLAVGMDDYVFAWPGNHSFMDRVLTSDEMKGYQGKLHCKNFHVNDPLPDNVLSKESCSNDSLRVIYTTPSPELHPELGKILVREYFQKYEDHLDARGRRGMNYFFQDELMCSPDMHSWCEDMPAQFKLRKGYDLMPHLNELFDDTPASYKVRLDYAEVLTELSEERFFKPVFDWHSSKGLIYGCDNEGRGLNPAHYVDYFRAISWFTAPGNDAPSRGSSFLQTKVSSSIAHIYDRPRTWLEAFHSMGWDANGAVLTHQLDHHIIAGGNLLCMHGLYYSTHGSWWEWAPPCFHFRMPYWPHMKKWLKYAERLCYVLSQGSHVCDVALLYPTEPSQVQKGYKADFCFDVASKLSEAGFDFDFIDYKSLQNANVKDAKLCIADEKYQVLVLAGIGVMHDETAAAVKAFADKGGKVLVLEEDAQLAVKYMQDELVPDFKARKGQGRVLHRKVGANDVYMVMDVAEGDSIFFRQHGKLECWDAMNGKIAAQKVLSCDDNGTWLRFDAAEGRSKLYVFSEGQPQYACESPKAMQLIDSLCLDGDWKVTLQPTMDNRWGDFRLPANDGLIGAEARSFICSSDCYSGEMLYGYAPYMLTSNGDDSSWQPYCWSWQYGVLDSPGSQGYHGLKSKVDSRFLILDQGCDQYFKTNVFAPASGKYQLVREGVLPDVIRIDGKDVLGSSLTLDKGWHELFLKYADTEKFDYQLIKLVSNTVDKRKRSMVMLYPEACALPNDKDPYGAVIASKWYDTDFLKFNAIQPASQTEYRFSTAPGTYAMETRVNGKVTEVLVAGKSVKFSQNADSLYITLSKPIERVSEVILTALPEPYSPGAALFKEPVRMLCKEGLMPAGDWTAQGAMKYYSGGVRYRKSVTVKDLTGKWMLELGEVDATCEVSVNGVKLDELLSSPFTLEVTDYLKRGKNEIEVLVYSSLSNHYQTIPTPYRGRPHAGLCGPVVLKNYSHAVRINR